MRTRATVSGPLAPPFAFLGVLALTAFGTQCANTVADAPVPSPAPSAVASGRPRAANLEDVSPAVKVPIDGLPVFGDARALVTVVMFTDYECPYCARAEGTIEQLRSEYGSKLRVVVASRPLPFHEHALPAAYAFHAAVAQGRGQEMHARLFAEPRNWIAAGDEGLRAVASDVGLDLTAFDRARTAAPDPAFSRSEALATALQVRGTPSFFVNGRRIVGAQPIATFRTVIEEELERAEGLVAQGVRPEEVYARVLASAPAYVPEPPELEIAKEVVTVDAAGAPARGEEGAPVTVVVFSDFECPYCARAAATLRAFQAANAQTVRVVYRHRPLPMHPHARLAAKAAIAADRQGKFWPYHDALFAHPKALERADLASYAAEVGLDTSRFLRDLDSPEVEAALAADEAQAASLSVRGTPTSFVDGHRVGGAQPPDIWVAAARLSLTSRGLSAESLRAAIRER